MTAETQLQYLQAQSAIDCDTLDTGIIESLGPFVDCTSNQAIVLAELQKPQNKEIITSAVQIALTHRNPTPTLVGEIASCLLSARILPQVTGFIHTQTNPLHAFSTSATVADARRIIAIYGALTPPVPRDRICIKVPSTWEGLQACRELEAEAIPTLATMIFTLTQAKMAARVGCTYIAPYVNELRVHFEEGVIDRHRGFDLCIRAQKWFEAVGAHTQVVAASFASREEVLKLGGLRHITVSGDLLSSLNWRGRGEKEDDGSTIESLVAGWAEKTADTTMGELLDEGAWRLAMNREDMGQGCRKLADAINLFSDVQEMLEELCQPELEAAKAQK